MNTKSVLAFAAVAVALAMIASPLITAANANAYDISQLIKQSQTIKQSSQCVSGTTTDASCNNVALNTQTNTGNQAAGSQD